MPQGDPEYVVLLPSGEALVGLDIRGLVAHLMLGIREDREGQPISCAVVTEFAIDTRLHSHPRWWSR